MWTDTRSATAWALGWVVLVTAGFLLTGRAFANRERQPTLSWPWILLLAGFVRLVPAVWLPVGAGYDIESFRLVTDALLGDREVYTSVLGRHPYLPFQMYIMGGMAAFAHATGLPYVVAIKLPAILADVALTGLIFRALQSKESTRSSAVYLALLFALNPVSILVTSYHGQFEAVTLLFLVLSWYFWEFSRRIKPSGIALGLAILNKTWPVVFLPVVLMRIKDRRSQVLYSLLAIGIPVMAVLAYLVFFSAEPLPMLRRALTHRGVAGYWGVGAVLAPAANQLPSLQLLIDFLFSLRNWLLLAAVTFALWQTRRRPALDAILTLLLCLFVVTVGFGIQWLIWLVPFGLLAGEDRWIKIYSLAAAFMLVVHLYGLHLYPWLSEWLSREAVDWMVRLSALPAWMTVVGWTASRLRRVSSEDSFGPNALEIG
jgi:hypothetical protein